MASNSSAPAAAAPPEIPFAIFAPLFAHVYGVALAGIFASCILYGICCMQVFMYYATYSKDHWVLHSLPGVLIVLETVHQLINCIGLYRVVITNFGNQAIVVSGIWEIYVATIFQSFIAMFSQAFFVYRVWSFSKRNWIFPTVCIPVILCAFATTFGDQIIALSETLEAYTQSKVNIGLTYAAHGSDLLVDTITTVSMLYLLYKEKKLTKIRRTGALINRLMVVTINTGMVTAACTFLVIVFFAREKDILTYIFFVFLIPTLYCNTVMANLNSRDYIRRGVKKGPNNFTSDLGNSVELGNIRVVSNTITSPSHTRGNESTALGTMDGYTTSKEHLKAESTNTTGYDDGAF